MADISLINVNKIYSNNVQAVFDFNLEIKDKDFIVLVGPSGCGKSTTLRMIAGLEEISSGELFIDGELMNEVPSKDRGIAMVFQSYALYPQMTVYDNMAFGLKLRKIPKDEIKRRITEASAILGLDSYLDRKPKALSGGQRQRVALGRAIVRDAKVFLFDEPLSNLDAKLRVQMRTEISKLHKKLGSTSIYVTHDQIEAMTMASRIVVMKDGHIQQIGSPTEIYHTPANVFVGGFIGTPPMNFIPGTVTKDGFFSSDNGTCKLAIPKGKLEAIINEDMFEKPVLLGIRPEDIHNDDVVVKTYPDATVEITVDVCEMLGHETNVYFQIENSQIICLLDSRTKVQENEKLKIAFDMNQCHFFNVETEKRIG